jgi:hypothetical protein
MTLDASRLSLACLGAHEARCIELVEAMRRLPPASKPTSASVEVPAQVDMDAPAETDEILEE